MYGKRRIVGGLIIAILAVVAIDASTLGFIDRALYSETRSIDISSGDIKTETRIAIFHTSNVSKSWMSEQLKSRPNLPNWKTVSSRTFSTSSPNYQFHSAIHQIHNLYVFSIRYNVSPQRQKEIANQVMKSWSSSGSSADADHLVRSYCSEVSAKQLDGF